MGFPLQLILVQMMVKQRKKGVVITDQRIRLTTEVCVSQPPVQMKPSI